MPLIITIALGVVLGIIILNCLPEIFSLVMIVIFLALIIIALMLIWEYYRLVLVIIALLGLFIGIPLCFSYLWRKLPFHVQWIFRLFGWGVPAVLVTALWIWFVYAIVSGQTALKTLESCFVILISAAPMFGFCFAFYRTWKKPDKLVNIGSDPS
jgi:hypothetical protein